MIMILFFTEQQYSNKVINKHFLYLLYYLLSLQYVVKKRIKINKEKLTQFK